MTKRYDKPHKHRSYDRRRAAKQVRKILRSMPEKVTAQLSAILTKEGTYSNA